MRVSRHSVSVGSDDALPLPPQENKPRFFFCTFAVEKCCVGDFFLIVGRQRNTDLIKKTVGDVPGRLVEQAQNKTLRGALHSPQPLATP